MLIGKNILIADFRNYSKKVFNYMLFGHPWDFTQNAHLVKSVVHYRYPH